MEKKKEDSGKRLYFTSENGECSSYSIVSGAEKLDEYSKTRTLPQVSLLTFLMNTFTFLFSFFFFLRLLCLISFEMVALKIFSS